ncbi:hypothetical protein SORBI_3007G031400 [Sorghum bicolor]|uniref:Uncharacterized protein n=1 Tax=Sorghum bicolor TaxID=4558 RepID=A0A1B6PF89_SORBI|nr:hypothetical protein SORBI_3007G031400 [Sorghum bicolor]
MAAAGAAAPVVTGQQQQQQQQVEEALALFASKHAELLCEARGVAREHGVTVRTVAFRPDGKAVAHELIGVAREERLRGMVGRAVARDVSAMGPREVAAHQRQLHALRAVVLRELQAKKKPPPPAAAAKDDDAGAKTKRALEQRETDGAGAGAGAAESNKSRRTDY